RNDGDDPKRAGARNAAGDAHDHEMDANGGYENEAMAVLEAIALNSRAVLILNTANRSALPFLDERAVVEVPCVVGRAGPVPTAAGQVPSHTRALVEMMKDVERTTIDAALLGSRELAIKALALHPLVPSVSTAREIFDGYRSRLPALQEAFRAGEWPSLARSPRSWICPSPDLRGCPARGRSGWQMPCCAPPAVAPSPRSAAPASGSTRRSSRRSAR